MTDQLQPLIAIIDPNGRDLAETRHIIAESGRAQVVGTATRMTELADLMLAEPDIVLLDPGPEASLIEEQVHQVYEYSPRCQVLLTVAAGTSFDPSRAMKVGVRAVLTKPLTAAELMRHIFDVFTAEQRRISRIEERAAARATSGRAGEIITVFSPKGGVGCTTIASNLAIDLARSGQSKVALVDLSLQFGDVGVVLNLRSNHGVHELMRNVHDLDLAILDDVMLAHSSGVKVLLPPPTLDLVEEVDPEGITAVLKALRRYYDFVVVDTWHAVEDATMMIMDLSDHVLVITTPEVPSLRNVRRFLDHAQERSRLHGKTSVIVNRYPSKGAVEMKDIESSLGLKPIGAIPSDGRLVTSAINEGVSFLSKKSPVRDSFAGIASQFAQRRKIKTKRAFDSTRPLAHENAAAGAS